MSANLIKGDWRRADTVDIVSRRVAPVKKVLMKVRLHSLTAAAGMLSLEVGHESQKLVH